MQPKVSIIVPVYNPPAQYLRECLDSICNQTLKEIEIILIDNAAIGDNPQILKEYAKKDKRIKLFRFEKNQGYSSACNKGLEMATGEYIHFADSDDLVRQDTYQILYNILKNKNLDIIIFFYDWYDTSTNTIKHHQYTPQDEKPFSFHNNSSRLSKYLTLWNKVIKKDLFETHQIRFDSRLKCAGGDVLISIKSYLAAAQIAYINQTLYIWRINRANSGMQVIKSKSQELFILANDIISIITKQKLPQEYTAYLLALIASILHDNYKVSTAKLKFYIRLKLFVLRHYKLFKSNISLNNNFQFIKDIHHSSTIKTIIHHLIKTGIDHD